MGASNAGYWIDGLMGKCSLDVRGGKLTNVQANIIVVETESANLKPPAAVA